MSTTIRLDSEYPCFVLVDQDGDLQGQDQASGGYPYKAFTLKQVTTYDRFDDALAYQRMFKHLEIKAATLSIAGREHI